MAIKQNFQTDTKLRVAFDSSRGLWKWSVVTSGTVSIGGTEPRVETNGYSESMITAVKTGAYKMRTVIGDGVIGTGVTFHTNDAGVIRLGISTLSPLGYTGGRGSSITVERFSKGS